MKRFEILLIALLAITFVQDMQASGGLDRETSPLGYWEWKQDGILIVREDETLLFRSFEKNRVASGIWKKVGGTLYKFTWIEPVSQKAKAEYQSALAVQEAAATEQKELAAEQKEPAAEKKEKKPGLGDDIKSGGKKTGLGEKANQKKEAVAKKLGEPKPKETSEIISRTGERLFLNVKGRKKKTVGMPVEMPAGAESDAKAEGRWNWRKEGVLTIMEGGSLTYKPRSKPETQGSWERAAANIYWLTFDKGVKREKTVTVMVVGTELIARDNFRGWKMVFGTSLSDGGTAGLGVDDDPFNRNRNKSKRDERRKDPPAIRAAEPVPEREADSPIIGSWNWLNKGTTTVSKDGTIAYESRDGSKTLTGKWKRKGATTYVFSWKRPDAKPRIDKVKYHDGQLKRRTADGGWKLLAKPLKGEDGA